MHSPLSPAARRVSSKEPSCQVHSTGAAEQFGTTERVATGKGHVMQECGSLDARQEVVNDSLRVTWKKHQRSNFFPSPRVFLQDQRISPFVKLAANQADPVTCTFCSTQSSFPRSESTFSTTPSPWRKVKTTPKTFVISKLLTTKRTLWSHSKVQSSVSSFPSPAVGSDSRSSPGAVRC